ncbi:MAG: hypothetical protein SFZ23_04300 [Planctomycetota bacterium]|nr:hypothetical protein [Planctomycetota bacterium]
MARKAGTARASGQLANLSVMDIERELRRRQQKAAGLQRKYDRLAARLEELGARIEALGGSGGRRGPGRPVGSGLGRKRPKNETNLVDALEKVLSGKTMGVTEVSEAVIKAGYQTTSKTFRTIVNQTLIKNPKRFKKVARGQYTAA